MAPASHMPAPVVRPDTSRREAMIMPLARNATPAVTASMMRMGSAPNTGSPLSAFSRIANVMSVNSAAARPVSICVRNPAGLSRSSGPMPMAPASRVAASSRITLSMSGSRSA
jgi:hypothetical protein